MTLNDLMNVDLNPLAHPEVTGLLENEALWAGIGIAVIANIGLVILASVWEIWTEARKDRVRYLAQRAEEDRLQAAKWAAIKPARIEPTLTRKGH